MHSINFRILIRSRIVYISLHLTHAFERNVKISDNQSFFLVSYKNQYLRSIIFALHLGMHFICRP